MTLLIAQMIVALVVLLTPMMLLLVGYLLWLQRRGVAEPDRQRAAQRQRLAAQRTGRHLPPVQSSPR